MLKMDIHFLPLRDPFLLSETQTRRFKKYYKYHFTTNKYCTLKSGLTPDKFCLNACLVNQINKWVYSLVSAFDDSVVGSYGERTVSGTDVTKVGDRLRSEKFLWHARCCRGGEGLPPLVWITWIQQKCVVWVFAGLVKQNVSSVSLSGWCVTCFGKQLRDVCEDELHHDGLNSDLHEGRCTVKPRRLDVLRP